MDGSSILIYLLIFVGATLLVILPLIRWAKYNLSMVTKQKLTLWFIYILGFVALALLIFKIFL